MCLGICPVCITMNSVSASITVGLCLPESTVIGYKCGSSKSPANTGLAKILYVLKSEQLYAQ